MSARFAFGFALVLVACKAKPGGSCSGGGVCDGAEQALLCVDGKYVATSCKGPDHCHDPPFWCDFRGDAAGEPCSASAEMRSRCSPDNKSRIQCTDGKVVRQECDGPRGCYQRPNGTSMVCDAFVKVGDACVGGCEDWCSADQKQLLSCIDSKVAVAGQCRGPSGCRMGALTTCDVSIGAVNDVCAGDVRACTSDGASVLVCDKRILRVDTTCPAGKACRPVDGTATCAAR